MGMRLYLSMLAASALAPSAIADPPSPGFWLMGYPAGGKDSSTYALSQDGSVAGGYTTSPGFPGAAFSWTAQGGRNDWGIGAGLPPYSPVFASNSAGDAFAGWMTPGPGPNERAFRRVGNGPIEDLGTLPGETRSFASGMSGDGNTVVGHAEHGDWTNAFGQAFRWTPSGGMQGLGYLKPQGTYSVAEGISRDGKTIVGISQSFGPAGPKEAFVWTEATGMKGLPGLPNAPFLSTYARAVNAHGSVVVGDAPHSDGNMHAVRWIDGQIEDLGIFGSFNWHTLAVDDSGDVIGGVRSSTFSEAFVWTAGTGMMDLSEYLALHGILTPANYRLDALYAISGDGLTFAGQARNLLTNKQEGFVATVPTPGAAFLILLAVPLIIHRRRR